MAGVLHVFHGHNGQEMAGCQAVCRGIKTNIEGNFFLSQKIADLCVSLLLQEASLLQNIVNIC